MMLRARRRQQRVCVCVTPSLQRSAGQRHTALALIDVWQRTACSARALSWLPAAQLVLQACEVRTHVRACRLVACTVPGSCCT
jgi:hypothetical protein